MGMAAQLPCRRGMRGVGRAVLSQRSSSFTSLAGR